MAEAIGLSFEVHKQMRRSTIRVALSEGTILIDQELPGDADLASELPGVLSRTLFELWQFGTDYRIRQQRKLGAEALGSLTAEGDSDTETLFVDREILDQYPYSGV